MPEKMQRPADDKALKPVEDKAPLVEESAEDKAHASAIVAEPTKPRFDWQATSSDAKQATQGPWRIRVQRGGGTGRWRPFVEWMGEDFADETTAERMLERLLR